MFYDQEQRQNKSLRCFATNTATYICAFAYGFSCGGAAVPSWRHGIHPAVSCFRPARPAEWSLSLPGEPRPCVGSCRSCGFCERTPRAIGLAGRYARSTTDRSTPGDRRRTVRRCRRAACDSVSYQTFKFRPRPKLRHLYNEKPRVP